MYHSILGWLKNFALFGQTLVSKHLSWVISKPFHFGWSLIGGSTVWPDGAIFVWPWKVVLASVCYFFYQQTDGKIKTWTLLSCQRNPNVDQALFDWPTVLQYDVKIVSIDFKKFLGHEVFWSNVLFNNQSKAMHNSIHLINQSNRCISISLLFLFCSCVFISRSYENHSIVGLKVLLFGEMKKKIVLKPILWLTVETTWKWRVFLVEFLWKRCTVCFLTQKSSCPLENYQIPVLQGCSCKYNCSPLITLFREGLELIVFYNGMIM